MPEQIEIRSIRDIKEYASRLPEPVRTLILSAEDNMTEQEFLSKFIEWRKLIKMSKGVKD